MSRHTRPSVQRTATTGSQSEHRPATAIKDSRSTVRSSRGRTESKTSSSEEYPRASSRDSATDSSDGQFFACPYSKFDPDRYSHVNIDKDESEYRNCSTGYWTSISRLKQHLYRTHDRSQRCTRCWKHFPTEKSLQEHVEKRGCTPKTEPEGLMTTRQHEAISRREHGQEVEKWLKIYQILFPDDDLPGSVYPEWVTGRDFRVCFELLEKAVPALLYKKFARGRPNLQGTKPDKTTMFATNAQVVQEVLEECKQGFISRMGPRLGPVFSDEPLDTARPQLQHADASSSTGRKRNSGERDGLSSSSSEANVDDELRRLDMIRKKRIEEESRRARGGNTAPPTSYQERSNIIVPIPTTMGYTVPSVPTTYAQMPAVTQGTVPSFYGDNTMYSMYDVNNLNQYNWQQDQ